MCNNAHASVKRMSINTGADWDTFLWLVGIDEISGKQNRIASTILQWRKVAFCVAMTVLNKELSKNGQSGTFMETNCTNYWQGSETRKNKIRYSFRSQYEKYSKDTE